MKKQKKTNKPNTPFDKDEDYKKRKEKLDYEFADKTFDDRYRQTKIDTRQTSCCKRII